MTSTINSPQISHKVSLAKILQLTPSISLHLFTSPEKHTLIFTAHSSRCRTLSHAIAPQNLPPSKPPITHKHRPRESAIFQEINCSNKRILARSWEKSANSPDGLRDPETGRAKIIIARARGTRMHN